MKEPGISGLHEALFSLTLLCVCICTCVYVRVYMCMCARVRVPMCELVRVPLSACVCVRVFKSTRESRLGFKFSQLRAIINAIDISIKYHQMAAG